MTSSERRWKRGEKARGVEKAKGEGGEEDCSFLSFLFVVALVHAVLLLFESAARPFVVPVLPFVSPARNETPCLWLSVTQWASQIKPSV